MIFRKALQDIMKQGLTYQIMTTTERKKQESFRCNDRGSVCKSHKFFGLRVKSYIHLRDDGNELKKQRTQRSMS